VNPRGALAIGLGALVVLQRVAAWRRGSNSAAEDSAEKVSTSGTDADPILGALGWPYFWGRGSPSTPWSDGPKGVDCSGFAQMALVKLGILKSSAGDRGARALADASDPVEVGDQQVGDLAYYPGHVMIVVGPPGDDGHSSVMGASGGGSLTFGNDKNARVKLFSSGKYRDDFVTYMRLRA
jgi:cell wall-associated NlpC family hydrolase